ncbi:MAG: DUF1064 domain-containing protein [Chlamydiia bacterium]|nr:DUF1064 domain-containing protein [Chlamydiia bacterium]
MTHVITKNKYGAIRTLLRGEWFHSKLESSFYIPLLNFCEKHKFELKRQVKYEVYKSQKKSCNYLSDFTIYSNNLEFIVDAKGVQTSISKMKTDIVTCKYNLPIYIGNSVAMCIHKMKKVFKV